MVQIGGDRFIAKVDPVTQKRTKLGSVPADNSVHPPWVHDIPATENYIIVPDTPILYDFSLSVSTPSTALGLHAGMSEKVLPDAPILSNCIMLSSLAWLALEFL